MDVTQEPEPDAPIVDFIFDRIGYWLVFGGFGATLGLAIAHLLERTGLGLPGLGALVGGTATLALAALAELGISVRNKLEEQFPAKPLPRPWTEDLVEEET